MQVNMHAHGGEHYLRLTVPPLLPALHHQTHYRRLGLAWRMKHPWADLWWRMRWTCPCACCCCCCCCLCLLMQTVLEERYGGFGSGLCLCAVDLRVHQALQPEKSILKLCTKAEARRASSCLSEPAHHASITRCIHAPCFLAMAIWPSGPRPKCVSSPAELKGERSLGNRDCCCCMPGLPGGVMIPACMTPCSRDNAIRIGIATGPGSAPVPALASVPGLPRPMPPLLLLWPASMPLRPCQGLQRHHGHRSCGKAGISSSLPFSPLDR